MSDRRILQLCSYVVFDRRCDLNLSTDELYEVPEGFVDQGIDKGEKISCRNIVLTIVLLTNFEY